MREYDGVTFHLHAKHFPAMRKEEEKRESESRNKEIAGCKRVLDVASRLPRDGGGDGGSSRREEAAT